MRYPCRLFAIAIISLGFGLPLSVAAQDAVQETANNNEVAINLWLDAFNNGVLENVEDFIGPDFLLRDPDAPLGTPLGPEGFVVWVTAVRAGFPDWQLNIFDQFGEEDWMGMRWRVTGTFSAGFPLPDGTSLPPTGNRVELDGIYMIRFEDGKMAEMWNMYDSVTLQQLMGLLPAPETEVVAMDLGITAAATPEVAPAPPPPPSCAIGTTLVHVVARGENLYRIGLRYGTTAAVIAAANGITNPGVISVGQRLIIPCGVTSGVAGVAPVAPVVPVPPPMIVPGFPFFQQYYPGFPSG